MADSWFSVCPHPMAPMGQNRRRELPTDRNRHARPGHSKLGRPPVVQICTVHQSPWEWQLGPRSPRCDGLSVVVRPQRPRTGRNHEAPDWVRMHGRTVQKGLNHRKWQVACFAFVVRNVLSPTDPSWTQLTLGNPRTTSVKSNHRRLNAGRYCLVGEGGGGALFAFGPLALFGFASRPFRHS